MLDDDGAPIIGLTISTIGDSFWFTLLHELVHAWKHLPDEDRQSPTKASKTRPNDDANEAEANRLAKEAFIPRSLWKRGEAFLRPSAESIWILAEQLNISPAW